MREEYRSLCGEPKKPGIAAGVCEFWTAMPLLEEFAVEGEHMPGRADIRVLEDAGLISEAQVLWRDHVADHRARQEMA
jgi:hypothetical protein